MKTEWRIRCDQGYVCAVKDLAAAEIAVAERYVRQDRHPVYKAEGRWHVESRQICDWSRHGGRLFDIEAVG